MNAGEGISTSSSNLFITEEIRFKNPEAGEKQHLVLFNYDKKINSITGLKSVGEIKDTIDDL